MTKTRHKRVYPNGIRCSKCETIKPTSEFHASKQNPDGYCSYCIPCVQAYRQRYNKGTGPGQQRKQQNGLLWCNGCEQYLEPNVFHANKTAKTGKTSRCKQCTNRSKEQLTKGTQRCSKCKTIRPLTDFQKDSGRKCGHDARCKQCRYKGKIPWEHRHLPREQYRHYERKAKERGIAFHLSLKDFCDIAQGHCTYCGNTVSLSKHGMGVDRADNTKGYQKDNCVPCCTICNWMKNSLDIDTFDAHIKRIFDHRNL